MSQNESILENGAQCLEIWEADYHLKPGKFFFFFFELTKSSSKGKGYFGQEGVPPSPRHQIFPGCLHGRNVVERVQGLGAELARVLSEVFRHE